MKSYFIPLLLLGGWRVNMSTAEKKTPVGATPDRGVF
jgi:hypothetical protein